MTRSRDIDAALPEQSIVALQGESREIYGFTAFPLTSPPPVAGIYVLVRPAAPDDRDTLFWDPVYVGEAPDVEAEISSPRSQLLHARELGATHLLVRICGRGEAARREVARDLVASLAPLLNEAGGAAQAA